MLKTISENKVLYFVWFICMLISILGVITTPLLSLLVLVCYIMFALFNSSVDSLVLLVGLMPFANIFKLSPNSTSLFTICQLFLIFILVFKSGKIKSNVLVPFLLLLIHMLTFSINNLNLLLIIKILTAFLLIYYSIPIINKSDFINMTYMLSLSMLITLALAMNESFFSYLEPFFMDLDYYANIDATGNFKEIFRFSGFIGDPNYSSIIIIISLSIMCLLYYYKDIKNEFWFLFIPLIVLGFFSYSKSYFLCALALIVFLIIFVLAPKHKGWALFSLIAIAIIISIALSGQIEFVNIVVERFETGDLTTGRFDLNEKYMEYIVTNWKVLLFGEGVHADRFEGAANNVHNIYIELIFKLGLIGGLLFVILIISSCNNFHKSNSAKKHVINFLPLFFILIMLFFLAGITSYSFPYYFLIAISAMNYESLPTTKTFDPVIKLKG